jgi:hypothetical protein
MNSSIRSSMPNDEENMRHVQTPENAADAFEIVPDARSMRAGQRPAPAGKHIHILFLALCLLFLRAHFREAYVSREYTI